MMEWLRLWRLRFMHWMVFGIDALTILDWLMFLLIKPKGLLTKIHETFSTDKRIARSYQSLLGC